MMFGTPPLPPARCMETPGNDILVMKNVSGSGGRTGLKNCDVVVREGEVVGLAGLEGSGQGVFLRLAGGLKQPTRGSISLTDRDMKNQDHHIFIRNGVTFMPASRLEEGLISGLSITEHFALQEHPKRFLVTWPKAYRLATERIDNFRIKGLPDSQVDALSGGNQQRLQKYCLNKTSIIFSSSELDEILLVADRILVFFDGRIIKDVKSADTDASQLGKAIAGKA
jgi:simple sugar transport system ATP-binding protein